MKNLANCTPKEFLTQTNKIRKAVAKWLTLTDILNLREEAPKFEPLPNKATPEEIDAHLKEYKAAVAESSRRSLNNILDAVMDKHPDETLELLALVCFVEPKDVNNYTITEYIQTINELVSNDTVIDFFTSLARLAKNNISGQ
jgi:hypothetical protein